MRTYPPLEDTLNRLLLYEMYPCKINRPWQHPSGDWHRYLLLSDYIKKNKLKSCYCRKHWNCYLKYDSGLKIRPETWTSGYKCLFKISSKRVKELKGY